jgi:predicted lipoprotein
MRAIAARGALLIVIVGMVVAGAGCRERRRASVLKELTTDVAGPAYRDLATRSASLAEAADALAAAPSATTLDAARARWREALVAWKVTFPFRLGRLAALAPHFHGAYWPVEARKLDEIVAGSKPIDAAFVHDLGISAKGMFALERLLFGAPARKDAPATVPPLEALSGQESSAVRRRALVKALAADVAATARAASDVANGPQIAGEIAAEGQVALNRLVNDLVGVVENVVNDRLTFAVGAVASGAIAWTPYEGDASGSSGTMAASLLDGVARLYRPGASGGIGELVRATSPAAAGPVDEAMNRAVAGANGLGPSLADAARRDHARAQGVAAAGRALEVAMKTNVASALGVTLTFTAGDGD